MTNEELAKHWNVSLEEVKRISDFMNKNFYFCLAQKKETKLWHGRMYRMHISPSGNRTPHLWCESKQGFKTPREAAQNWNKLSDMIISESNPVELDVPKDAYKAIRKLELPSVIPHRQHESREFSLRGPRE